MKTIGVFEAKTRLSHYLSEVERSGHEIAILKRGKKVAILLSYRRHQGKYSKESADEVLGGLREVRAAFKKAPRLKAPDLIREGRKR